MTLQVRGLCKAYGQVVVADRIDIDLSVGQCLGVIGPNGAGKSSLFHLLTGTVAADAGHITLDGKALSGLPAHRRARLGVARAFQVPQPFGNLSVFQNTLAAASFAGGLRGGAAEQAAHDALRL
ncbi:ATP-binding cassette domain-containing protein, partial [Hydrogenophaga sp.]